VTTIQQRHYNINSINDNGLCVCRKPGENIERMIKRFKKKISKGDLINEIKRKMFYIKPSKLKRLKKMEGIQNQNK